MIQVAQSVRAAVEGVEAMGKEPILERIYIELGEEHPDRYSTGSYTSRAYQPIKLILPTKEIE